MNAETKKIIISDTSDHIPYEAVSAVIDSYFLSVGGEKEDIVVLCQKKDVGLSLGERYAIDRGLRYEYSHKAFLGVFGKSDFAKKRRMVKACQSLLLLFDGENHELNDWVKLAVAFKKPFKMEHFE